MPDNPRLSENIEVAIAAHEQSLERFYCDDIYERPALRPSYTRANLVAAISQALAQPPAITEEMVERTAWELCALEWTEANDQARETYLRKARRTLEAAHGVTPQKEETPKEQA